MVSLLRLPLLSFHLKSPPSAPSICSPHVPTCIFYYLWTPASCWLFNLCVLCVLCYRQCNNTLTSSVCLPISRIYWLCHTAVLWCSVLNMSLNALRCSWLTCIVRSLSSVNVLLYFAALRLLILKIQHFVFSNCDRVTIIVVMIYRCESSNYVLGLFSKAFALLSAPLVCKRVHKNTFLERLASSVSNFLFVSESVTHFKSITLGR